MGEERRKKKGKKEEERGRAEKLTGERSLNLLYHTSALSSLCRVVPGLLAEHRSEEGREGKKEKGKKEEGGDVLRGGHPFILFFCSSISRAPRRAGGDEEGGKEGKEQKVRKVRETMSLDAQKGERKRRERGGEAVE